jgi:hypothetical protein
MPGDLKALPTALPKEPSYPDLDSIGLPTP